MVHLPKWRTRFGRPSGVAEVGSHTPESVSMKRFGTQEQYRVSKRIDLWICAVSFGCRIAPKGELSQAFVPPWKVLAGQKLVLLSRPVGFHVGSSPFFNSCQVRLGWMAPPPTPHKQGNRKPSETLRTPRRNLPSPSGISSTLPEQPLQTPGGVKQTGDPPQRYRFLRAGPNPNKRGMARHFSRTQILSN